MRVLHSSRLCYYFLQVLFAYGRLAQSVHSQDMRLHLALVFCLVSILITQHRIRNTGYHAQVR